MKNTQICSNWKRPTLLLAIFMLAATSVFSQQLKPNEYYNTARNPYSLDSIFPVDDIIAITVTNFSGTHTLTKKELTVLKQQLKAARSGGGLLVKPGHITISIKLQTKTKAEAGFVYAYNGMVNFDGGINRFGKRFSGSYYLPAAINFDNYK